MEPNHFPPPDPPVSPVPSMPALWNPQAAVAWSLLFTPAFGATLHAANWRTLGDPARARANTIWAWATLAMLVGVAVLVLADPSDTAGGFTRYIGLAWLLAWNFSMAQRQITHVKNALGGNYVKKGWGRPLLIAFGLLLVYAVVIFGLAFTSALSSPRAMADTVRPLILENWHKRPGLEDAKIDSLTLDHRDGNVYTGSLDATLHGEHQHLPLRVTRNGTTIEWEFK